MIRASRDPWKFFEWGLCVWLVGVTVRYGATTWKTLQHPFNPGLDGSWFAGWAVACGLLLLGCFFLPPRTLTLGTLGICTVVAAAIFTLSHTWLAAVIGLLLLLICWSIGLVILDRLKISIDNLADSVAFAIPTGMATLSLAVLTLGLAGRLTAVWIAGLLGVGLLVPMLSGMGKRKDLFLSSFDALKDSALPLCLIAFAAIVNLTWAVAPEVQFDALNYHLAVPQIYLETGALVDIRFLHAYLSKLLELLFAMALALGGQTAVKLFVYALGLSAAATTFALGRSLFDARTGAWAAALFYTTPIVAWLTGTVYTDNILALFAAAVLLAFVKWFQTREAGWFLAASIVAGVAVGTKLNAVFAFIFVLPVMAFGLRRQWRSILSGAFAFLLVAAPTYLLTWNATGNPVFPFLNGVFKSPVWQAKSTIFNATEFGMPATLSNLAVFPFRLTLDTTRFGDGIPRGALGISLLLALPFALFFVPRMGTAVRGVLAAAVTYTVILFFAMQYARYYVVILPAITVLGVGIAFDCSAARKSRIADRLVKACLIVAMVMQFPALSVQYWNLPDRFPTAVALGLESRDSFARRSLGGYSSAMQINNTAAEGDRILGVDVENLRFYLQPPLTTPPLSLLDDPVRKLSEIKPGGALAVAIKQAGFSRMLVANVQINRLPPAYPYLDKAFLDTYAMMEFSDEIVSVYRFK